MDEVCNKLQTYDMLVIGFGDCYDIDNTNKHLDKNKSLYPVRKNQYCLLMIQHHIVIIKMILHIIMSGDISLTL